VERTSAYQFIRDQVQQGRQAYVVCPLVEESEKTDLRAAQETYEHLSKKVFPGLRVGLLHGRLKSVEKEEMMARFAANETQILVATTVIEVGVDMQNDLAWPNSTNCVGGLAAGVADQPVC
jgi:ATP-dependent DNA helicase RecG